MLTIGPQEWQLQGDFTTTVVVAGYEVEVLARPVEHEIRRRTTQGPPVGSLERAPLVALAQLPEGLPVPWAEVDLQTRLALDVAPAGVLKTDGERVTRVYRPPVEIAAIISEQRPWSRGLQEVSLFAAVAPRVLRLAADPGDGEELRARAERLGVGVFVDGELARPLTKAPSRQKVREDARNWEFAEAAYRASLNEAAATPSETAAAI